MALHLPPIRHIASDPHAWGAEALLRGHHPVLGRVGPAALRIPAGGSATFTVSVTGPGSATPLDDGYVVWRGADGTRLRIPVVLSR